MADAFENITRQKLLSIPTDEPERLFAQDKLTSQYRALVKRWHPDVNPDPDAATVLIHLHHLYENGRAKLAAGTWAAPNARVFLSKDDRKIKIHYRRRKAFELGEVFVADTVVTYIVQNEYRDLFDHGLRMIRDFRYADTAMQEAIEPCLPQVLEAFEFKAAGDLPEGQALVLQKPKEALLLSDLLAYSGDALDPRHVAWIISGLQNIGCWAAWCGISHNAIGLDTVFVSPEHHAIYLLGGWFYSTTYGTHIRALPVRTANVVPSEILRKKCADARVDQTLIRLLGCELLGDSRGLNLAGPKPLTRWLTFAPSDDAVENYREWEFVREASFGRRAFVPLPVTAENLYPKP